ncbi:MAG: hypothetical protein ACI9CO_000028 [Candidatus Azotimanducaceae bacterium]|jgi:hypothetical protein
MESRANKYHEIRIDPDKTKELTDVVLSLQHPLGKFGFEYANAHYDSELYQLLFNWHPDHFHENEGIRPGIILGRRGSGKSSYLNNLARKEHVIPIPVKSWDVVDLVEQQVREILKDQENVDPEKVSEIWHLVFLTLATREAIKHKIVSSKFREILDNFPIKEMASLSITALASNIMAIFGRKYIEKRRETQNISLVLEAMQLGFDSLSQWETFLSDGARKANKYLILMIDNPERLIAQKPTRDEEWDKAYSESSTARWQSYAGLLHLIAHFHESKVGIQIRYCVAAEQYFFLQERSSAILKDFADVRLLHWSSGDLLSSLAHRYMIYLQFHPENRDEDKYQELLNMDIYRREGAQQFFNSIFESEIVNGRLNNENPVDYLLRHTQLLPRQLLVYMNAAMQTALTRNPKTKLTTLRVEDLKYAVEEFEELLATEIIDSFSDSFPEGGNIIDNIQNLPIHDVYKNYKKNWQQFGANKALREYSNFPQVTVDSDRLMKFFTEVGILGRALNTANEEGYLNVEFEYTLPRRLHANPSDLMAIHPIFSSYTDPQSHSQLDPSKGVYPKGSSLDDLQDKSKIQRKYVRKK